jgi:GT2 family glycosyltransferase
VAEEFNTSLPNLRLLRQDTKGPAAARNLGFRSSEASIFICVDSDVVCEQYFLLRICEALDQHPDWVAAETTVLPMGEKSPLYDAPENHGGTYVSAAVGYRSQALCQVGGFDEVFQHAACEDAEIGARLLTLGIFGYVPDAVVYHPSRRVTFGTHWRWRKFWRYVMILAKRYGFLAFPGKPAGPFPRLRVALAAVVTLPAGRLLESLSFLKSSLAVGAQTFVYGLFDVLCGFCALPDILFSSVPERRDYLSLKAEKNKRSADAPEEKADCLTRCSGLT